MVLIITNKEDITSDYIIYGLLNRKKEYYRFNTEEIGNDVEIFFNFKDEKFFLFDKNKEKIIDLSEVTSIYYRRPQLPNYDTFQISKGEKHFLRSEVYHFLNGLYKVLHNKFWINSVYAIRETENKIYQIIKAMNIGFKIPESIITTIPKQARIFYQQYKPCIIKPIKQGFIHEDDLVSKLIFTNRIKDEQIEELERVSLSPTYMQREIVKKADIRVTIVGEKIFAAQILSQACEETVTDWRCGEHQELDYQPIDLPDEIENNCIQLTHEFNLNFGAIDLVLDKNEEYYFLEINPNGQWAWIQNRLGFKISDALIDMLLAGRIL